MKVRHFMGLQCLLLLVATTAYGAWTIATPTYSQDFKKTSNVSGAGKADAQDQGFVFEFIDGTTTVVSINGTSSGPPNMPQMATWSATLEAPSGGWPVGTSKKVKLTPGDMSGSVEQLIDIVN